KTSSEKYNQELSERRARAVMAYLMENSGIAAARMKAVGFGFSRPKAPNDPVHGNHLNRRVEVYLRGVDKDSMTEEERSLSSMPAEDK
ncbi:MAG: OmpA family protein, partial [Lentisphaerae bacterium]|nr:OmpA family protein [Lentisphaerota bacterium]